MGTRMLDGYKVLDFTQALAGPTTTRYLGQMGAEIIKVEIAPNGDLSRGVPFMRDGRSAYYVQQNRGKKSLCLDPKKPAGLAILKALVPQGRCTGAELCAGRDRADGARLRSDARL